MTFSKINRPMLILLLTLLSTGLTFAQAQPPTARVLTHNDLGTQPAHPIVNIKWYHQQFVYKQGVNVYRREYGQDGWTKLNDTPIVLQKNAPAAMVEKDEDLDAFVQMANGLGTADNEGFFLLTLFAKSFQSADYARTIGIQYDDHTAAWGHTYEYRVRKVAKQEEITLGVSSPITVGPYQPEDAVKDFHAARNKRIVKMRWQEEESRFYAVNIYRRSREDSTWIKLNRTPVVMSETDGAPNTDAMFQDGQVAEGMRYDYCVAGLDFFGEETAWSAPQQVDMGDLTPPPPPVNPRKRVQKLNVILTWQPQPSDDLAGYHLYRSTLSDGPYSRITPAPVAQQDTTYTDTVPGPGFYYYYIAATDLAGNEANSYTIMAEVQDVFPPRPPQHLTAEPDTGRIVLHWKPNTEPDVMGYYIYRTINEDKQNNFLLVNADPLTDTVYVQKFARNASNKFLFRVLAVDSSYNRSDPSETVAARMPDVTAPIQPLIRNISQQGDSLHISWLANPEPDLQGFRLYRYPEGKPNQSEAINNLTASTATQYIDTSTVAGKYYFELEAIDQSGNASLHSDPFPIKKTNVFRYTFQDVKMKYRKGKQVVIITWLQQEGPMGYTVFRKAADQPNWRPVTGQLTESVFTDKTIQRKVTYEYQLRAYAPTGEVVRSEIFSIKTGK